MSHSSTNITGANNAYAFPESNNVPMVSGKSIVIFKENNLQVPESLNNLRGKVEALETVQAKLTNVKEHSTRNKIISILATMLALALIAGAVLGTYFGATAGTTGGAIAAGLIPMPSLFILYFLCIGYDYKWSEEKDRISIDLDYLYPLVMTIVGPFIPVWRTFRGTSQYQAQVTTKSTQVQRELEEVKQFFTENNIAVNELKQFLTNSIQSQNEALENLKNLPVKSPESETALSNTIEQLTQALNELNAISNFCAE